MASVLPCFTDSKKICPVCGMYIKALEEYREAVEIMDQLGIDTETKFFTEAMYTYRASEARAGRYFSFAKIGRYEAKSLARFACCSNKLLRFPLFMSGTVVIIPHSFFNSY